MTSLPVGKHTVQRHDIRVTSGVMTSLPVGKHTVQRHDIRVTSGVMTSLPVGKHTVQRHDIRVTSGVMTSLPVGKHTYLARRAAEVTSRHLGDTCVTSLPPRVLPANTTTDPL